MSHWKIIARTCAAAALTACAPQQPLVRATASGYPEATIPGRTVDEIRSAIMEACASRGALVQESSGNIVVCGKTMSGGEAIMARMVIGNSYSTEPERKVRFTVFQVGGNVRVTAQQWIETQMAFGQVKRMELNGNNQRNDIQAMLTRLEESAARPIAAPPSAPASSAQ